MKVLFLALAALLATSTGASADVFDTAATKMGNVFQKVRTVVFVLGAFGLVGLGVGAIFGAVKWKWFGALGIGLATVAVAQSALNYVVTDSGTSKVGGDVLNQG